PLILVRSDQLQPVDVVWTFGEDFCTYEHDEIPAFRAGDRGERAYADIVATITETTTLSNGDCGDDQPPKPGTQTYTVTYRWDEAASKFVPDSDAFKKLLERDENGR